MTTIASPPVTAPLRAGLWVTYDSDGFDERVQIDERLDDGACAVRFAGDDRVHVVPASKLSPPPLCPAAAAWGCCDGTGRT